MKKYTIKDSWGNKRIVYVKDLVHAVKLNNSKFRDIDTSSLMTLFTKYGKPYGYVCKIRPKMSSSGSKYLGQLTAYTLSPIGKYDMDKAKDLVDFLNKKGYKASIFAPNIIVTLKQDRSSGLYKRGHEQVSQYDSIKNNNIRDDDKVKYKVEVYGTGKLLYDIDKANRKYESYQELTEKEYSTFIRTTPEAATKGEIEDIRKDVKNPGWFIRTTAWGTVMLREDRDYKVKIISNDPTHYRVMFYGMSKAAARLIHDRFEEYRPWSEAAKYWYNKPNISAITPYTGRIRT